MLLDSNLAVGALYYLLENIFCEVLTQEAAKHSLAAHCNMSSSHQVHHAQNHTVPQLTFSDRSYIEQMAVMAR